VTKEKLNLFEFASNAMAKASASATKIVGCQMVKADLPGIPFDRIPEIVALRIEDVPRQLRTEPR
jgi:hypothetical protein